MKKVQGYVASDGKFFHTESEAQSYEKQIQRAKRIHEFLKAIHANTGELYYDNHRLISFMVEQPEKVKSLLDKYFGED